MQSDFRKTLKKAALLLFVVSAVACSAAIIYNSVKTNYPLRTIISDNSSKNAVKILFIGNSFLFVNSMPAVFSQMINAGLHKPCKIWQLVGPSYTWKNHWTEAKAQKIIEHDGPWDCVILQGEPLWDSPHFEKYGKLFADEIKRSGSMPIFFEEWSDKANELDQQKINASNLELSQSVSAPLIPVGEAWSYARSKGQKLYGDDNVHPNQAGTYFSACVIYSFILHSDPRGLPLRLCDPGSGEVLIELPAIQGKQLQDLAYSFCKDRGALR